MSGRSDSGTQQASPPVTPERSTNKNRNTNSGSASKSGGRMTIATPPSSSKRRNIMYSDRFIPSRTTTNLEEAFDMLGTSSSLTTNATTTTGSTSSATNQSGNNSATATVNESQLLMNNLIRSELLGQSAVFDYHQDASGRLDGANYKSPGGRVGRDSSLGGGSIGSGSVGSSNLFKFRASSSSIGSAVSTGAMGITDSPHRRSSGGGSDSGSDLLSSPSSAGLIGFGASPNRLSNTPSGRHSSSSSSSLLLATSANTAAAMGTRKPTRKIPKNPFKILDAPSLQDDYYLNLVDWSHSNVLSVALCSSVYLWSACTSKVTRLCDLGSGDMVTSISWALSGNSIAIGTNSGKIQIWDSTTSKMVRELKGHDSRVGALAWNNSMLASGSRDRSIYLQDIRIRSNHGSQHSQDLGSTGGSNRSNSSNNNSFLRSPHRPHSASSVISAIAQAISNSNNPVAGQRPAAVSASAVATEGTNEGEDEESHDLEQMTRVADTIAEEMLAEAIEGDIAEIDDFADDSDLLLGSSGGRTSSTTLRRQSLLFHQQPRPTPIDSSAAGTTVESNTWDDYVARMASTSISVAALNTSNSSSGSTGSSPSVVQSLHAHKQEVCGLRWSFDEKMLASGGNDNKLFVWEPLHGSLANSSQTAVNGK
jgi:WD40 repeat protein